MRTFYIEFADDRLVRCATSLRDRHGLIPVLWTGLAHMADQITAEFPHCHFLNIADVKRDLFPPEFKDLAHAPFDSVCQKVWNEWGQIILDQYSRWDTTQDFRLIERSQYFALTLVFWRALFDQLRPDCVIFPSAPHGVYDTIIYALCCELKVRTAMFNHTSVIPFSFVSKDYHSDESPLYTGFHMARLELEAGFKIAFSDLASQTQQQWQIWTSNSYFKDAIPWYMKGSERPNLSPWNKRMLKGWFRTFKALLRVDLFEWKRRRAGYVPRKGESAINNGSIQKQKGKLLEDSYTSLFSGVVYSLGQLQLWRYTHKFIREYHSLVKVDEVRAAMDGPYVYFVMGLQPELTSNPLAGVFCNFQLLANVLRAALPRGWKLIIKEHPYQFNYSYAGQGYRNPKFYRLLASMPDTLLAPIDADQFELIDRAKAVAVTVGTAGWQAIARGRPVLTFGRIWYDQVPWAFPVRCFEDCRRAIATIHAGLNIDQEMLWPFLKELEISATPTGEEFYVTAPGTLTTDEQIHAKMDMVARVLGVERPAISAQDIAELVFCNSPIELEKHQMSDSSTPLSFQDLPPVAQILVHRNVQLRNKLRVAENEMAEARAQIQELQRRLETDGSASLQNMG